MADAKRFLAIDLGAESGRAVVGSLTEGRIALEVIHRFPTGGAEALGILYWDVLNFYNNVRQSLAIYAERYGRELAGIGIDSWGVDFGLFDRDGHLVANPVHYRDARTDGMMEEAFRRMPREEIFRETGIQFIQLNTVFQLLSLVAHKSPWLEIAKRIILMPNIFTYFLTGSDVVEFTHATTTQLYNPRQSRWSERVLDAMEIPRDIMPSVVQPGTVIGPLRRRIADEVCLGEVNVIAPACHDTAAAVAAVPASRGDNWAYLSSGTWSLMGIEVGQPIINDESLRFNMTNEGGVAGTFRFLKNISGLWIVQECRRLWAREGHHYSYDDLAEMAARARPFCAFIDPNDPCFLNPADMPAAIVHFCERTGQQPPQTHGEFVRCALESIALRYRDVLGKIGQISSRKIAVLHIVGGGSRNRLLNQFTADATGVTVVAGPDEATALGNVLMQAIASGDLSSVEEGRAVVRSSAQLEIFEPREPDRWAEAWQRYCHFVQGQ